MTPSPVLSAFPTHPPNHSPARHILPLSPPPPLQLPVEAGQTWDKKYTYLDTAGRPVVVFTKDHVLPVHNQPFAVDFKLGTWALLHEPLLLVTGGWMGREAQGAGVGLGGGGGG